MKPLAQNSLIQNRYLIVHLIGKGGMGEVYLAVDQRLGSAVALKRTFFAGDETLGQAFEREAKTLARMRHPVLPKVSDHFGENEDQYLVMEHISGDDLAKRLESAQKPFPVSWVLFWADQLLDALAYLHSHEPPIIHRDIKPQNLKLTDENHIILLDFGLSKSSSPQTNAPQSGSSTGGSASIVGYTPHYAPMEQIRGVGTDARSDLYSLAATLYQLMTNVIPADALSRADSLLNGMEDPLKPLHLLNSEIPDTVSDVILKAMEVSQDKRFGDAREMQKVLRKAFNEMQQAMSAETVAFNLQADPDVAIDQPVGASLPKAVEVPLDEADMSGGYDQGATIAFEASSPDNPIRQADVKTEVFLAGSTPFPIADYANQSSQPESVPVQGEPPTPVESFTETTDFRTSDIDPNAGFSPDATVPFISVPNNADAGSSDFYTTPGFNAGNDTFSAPADQYQEEAAAAESSKQFESKPAAVVAPVVKKKSSGKFAVLFGGFAALIILAAVAAGGGWYYYTNFYDVQTEQEPTPYPTASVEPTPSPEPTFDGGFDSNSNSSNTANSSNSLGSNSNSDTDDNSNSLTVDPTPPQTNPGTTSTPRTQQGVPPRPTVTRTPRPVVIKPPVVKPQPGMTPLQ